ncbi:beta-ketoacyl reductase [Micromonospora sp. FIMYZ51]
MAAATSGDSTSRDGVGALTADEGLRLFDAALALPDAVLAPIKLDLTSRGTTDDLPPLFAGLIPSRTRRTAQGAIGTGALLRRLTGLPAAERTAAVLDVVQTQAALVLGHAQPATLAPDQPFSELGFDSLTAIEFRNRLAAATGTTLPATVVFDYPTLLALAEMLTARLVPVAGDDDGEQEVRALLGTIPLGRLRDAGLLDALLDLAGRGGPGGPGGPAAGPEPAGGIDDMDTDSLISLALGDAGSDDQTSGVNR